MSTDLTILCGYLESKSHFFLYCPIYDNEGATSSINLICSFYLSNSFYGMNRIILIFNAIFNDVLSINQSFTFSCPSLTIFIKNRSFSHLILFYYLFYVNISSKYIASSDCQLLFRKTGTDAIKIIISFGL